MSGRLPPQLPYHWDADGARSQHEMPAAGTLIALRHAAWRVIESGDIAEDLWDDKDRDDAAQHRASGPRLLVLRPARLGDDPRDRDHDVHLRIRGWRRGTWEVYPDSHYPVCVECGEPTPCRQTMAARVAALEAARAAKFDLPGVCPACEKPVTSRQPSIAFAANLEVPVGPEVTFHLRGWCLIRAEQYERRVVAADPTVRPRLHCPGHLTNHNDDTYDCTTLAACPGPNVYHQSYNCCECTDCHTRGEFGCYPRPGATRNDVEPAP